MPPLPLLPLLLAPWFPFSAPTPAAASPPPAREDRTSTALAAALAAPAPAPPDGRTSRCRTLNDTHEFHPPPTLAAWATRAESLRRRILVAAGLWPMPPRPPVEADVHGRLEGQGYSIERVSFPSRPGFLVTGSLYRPTGHGDGPHAAVLSPHGHFRDGRFCVRTDEEVAKERQRGWESDPVAARHHLQARCVQLARMGCVVFHYDMVGYADARQLPHGAGFGDVESELRLRSAFGVQTWNSLRALDFLAGLPDVDPTRIGVTGASGGGTQTFILCAIDERPAAAFPAVMVSTGMQGGCVCENASYLRIGTNNVELAALFAPRPLGLTGADDWTREIETKGYPELKALYTLFGEPEHVFAKCFPTFEHNYNRHARELMYAWFDRHLRLGLSAPPRESPFEGFPPAALTVFDADHPRPEAIADASELWSCTEAPLAALLAGRARGEDRLASRGEWDHGELRRVVGGALEVMVDDGRPGAAAVRAEVRRETVGESLVERALVLGRKDTDEAVSALLVTPRNWSGCVVVSVAAKGRRELLEQRTPDAYDAFDWHVALLESGAALLLPDVLLAGEEGARLAVHEGNHARYAGYTWGYNRTLCAERVRDVLTAVAYARGLPGATSVRLAGLGDAGPWVILARALAGEEVARMVAAPAWTFAAIDSLDDPNFLPGALRYGDLPHFLALGAPGAIRILGPFDHAVVRDAYAGHPDVAETFGVDAALGPDLARWLVRAP